MMRQISQYIFTTIALSASMIACDVSDGTSNNRSDSGPSDKKDGEETGDEHNGEASVPLKTLDTLSAEQSRALCMEANNRIDMCLEFALRTESVETCHAFMDSCDKETLDKYSSCEGMDFGSEGSCSVTPEQYLDCVEAYHALRSCDIFGKQLIVPETCRDVVKNCQVLSDDFGRPLITIPACRDVGDTKGQPEYDKDIYGADSCFPRPARLVLMGDSVTGCFSYIDDIQDCECYWKNLAGYIKDNYAPDLLVEGRYPDSVVKGNNFRGNIRDVAIDAQMIMGGPGHILVMISCLGWDLLELRAESESPASDATALSSIKEAIEVWRQDWYKLFDYFSDQSRFPNGVTFMINTIYSPTDQCPQGNNQTSFPNLSSQEEDAFQYAIQELLIAFTQERKDTITVDIYPSWLGHGHNYNDSSCPHYEPDKEYWMSDYTHANGVGYTHMGNMWKRVVDRIYDDNCRELEE